MGKVECSVCGEAVGKMEIGKHAGMHKREFETMFGRPPEDYDEVREKLGDGPADELTTLDDYRREP